MDRGQIIFLSVAALIIIFETIKGWRLGLVRQLVRFGAMVGAYTAAVFGAGMTVPFLRQLGYPDFILSCIGGTALFLVVYLLLSIIGGILFKRTGHQEVGLVWFFYGATGALLGIAFSLVLIFILMDAVRILGSVAEAGSSKSKGENPVLVTITGLKHSLENGAPGTMLQTVDPVPKKVYSVATKLGRVTSNMESLERFLSYPGAKELAERPEIQTLHQDPEILTAVRDHQFAALLKNEKIVKAANDPKVNALIKKFDLEKALDYSLKK